MENQIKPRDFSQDEIIEINRYIIANVPYSVLQTTLPITDNPIQKARIFTIVYRFINGAKNYVQEESTRTKLINLLENLKDIYNEIYPLILSIDNLKVNFGSHRYLKKLLLIYEDFEKNFKINNFIDVFLVFAEKQTLISLEEVTGFNLETDEGREAHKKLMGSGDKSD